MSRSWFLGVNCLGFLKLIVQVFFVCVELSWVGGEGWEPEGWGPEGWGPEGWRPEGWGPDPEKVRARRVGGQKFRSFFPSPAAKFVLFFPLWVSSR